ncbi:MAG: AMP-binding protein [Rhodobacteraceae bacterium]|nr:AMP-binding protein [Paracoccaceae bacterium]
MLRDRAEAHPDRPLLRIGALDQSVGDFNASVNRVAALLARLGVGPGGKVALMLGNSAEFLWGWFACGKLGAIYVPINTDYRGDILAYQLAKADVTHLLIEADWLDRLIAVADHLPALTHVLVRGGNGVAALKGRTLTPIAAAAAEHDREPDARPHYTDPHAISFTSGTTGPSKGVLASNCHVMTFALDWARCVGLVPADRLHSCLPQFHAIATWLGFLPSLMIGAHVTVVERFSASQFWDEVRAAEATIAHGIFSMIPILLKQPARPDDATQPARRFYIGQQNDAFEKRFNCRIIEVFGSTETGIVTYTPLDAERRRGSCGLFNTDTFDVALVDDADNIVGPGEVGEIVVRPRQPFAMLGEYYNMPRESLAAFRNQWFHTGDSARRDADGYVYFVDRKKDAIRRRGENISSFEVESVVNRIPEVLECAAVAVKSDLGEDEVKVCIVRAPGKALTAAQVWEFCDAQMPRFWVPRYLAFLDALPKTPNQKIQKYLLREADGAGDLHDRGERAGSARRGAAGA